MPGPEAPDPPGSGGSGGSRGGTPPCFWGVFGGWPSKKCKKRAPGQNMPLYQILVHQFCKKNGLWSRNLTLEQSSPPWEPYFWWVFQALFTPPTKNGHFSARKPAVSLRIFILKCDIRGWYNSSAKSNFWPFLGHFCGGDTGFWGVFWERAFLRCIL